ncbi:MAG TPA: TonB-dependent receptor [Albitalea sp.]|nr:TonB-dependent receptor [Albitalea sp.]
MKKLVIRVRPLCLVAASSIVSAQPLAAHAEVPSFELQPVTVTGSGAPRSLGSETAATSVLTRGDIERSGARDAVQVLNLLGTALVEQQGGPGTLAAVRIRGADSRDTLVLVDGVPINELGSGQALIEEIPADIIERVEVVRGNMSALYGSNATGGVVQIFTRRASGDGASPAQFSAGVGSRGTRSVSASVGAGNETIKARVSAGRELTDGFSAGNGPNANPDADGNRRSHATLGVDWSAAPGHRFGIDLSHIDGKLDYDDPRFGSPTDVHKEHLVQDGAALRGAHELRPDWTLAWRLARSRERRSDVAIATFGYTSDNAFTNDVGVLELGGALGAGWHAQAALEKMKQSVDSTSYTVKRRDVDVLRAGATYEAPWGLLRANLRHDRTSDFGSADTGLVGGQYKLGGGLSALANVSTSFTAPTFDFLFYDCGGFPCSNPDLRPERAHNVEAALQYEDAKTLLRATVYAVRYRDKIANDANFVPQNIARAKNQGLELTARHALGAWTLLGEASLQDPRDAADDSRLLRRARQQLALHADYTRGRWHAGAGLRHVGNRPDVGGVTLPSYTVVDASTHFALTPQWTVSASVENAFDRRYEPTVGYNGRPRGIFVSASWSPKH